ncbi:MAG: DUF4197 domain-containing protein [Deltaproteobacteria bacterium]|nr:DUF4197 domain-containing protein [Deltaproteobacteria bacterium]
MRKLFAIVLLITLAIIQTPSAHAGLGDFLEGIKKALEGEELSESKIIQGLKEALQIGTGNAVKTISKKNGYYRNPKIRIPLPEAVQKVEKVLRAVGYGPKVDEFELSMNRAAERAAPEAKALFWDAIKQMTFSDARKILNGRDNEATLYFKDKTHDRLHEIFKPIIHTAMSKVGVTRTYQDLEAKVRSIPFADRLNLDLNGYVTDKALDGLFSMVAEEERKIRRDPSARVTELLKEVFGSKER